MARSVDAQVAAQSCVGISLHCPEQKDCCIAGVREPKRIRTRAYYSIELGPVNYKNANRLQDWRVVFGLGAVLICEGGFDWAGELRSGEMLAVTAREETVTYEHFLRERHQYREN